MKATVLLCFGLAMLSACPEILAAPEDGPPPLPSGPLLQKMTSYSAIQINYAYASDQTNSASTTPAPPPAPTLFPTSLIRQLTLTRTKPLWRAARLDVDGNTVEEWYDGSDYFYTAPGVPEPLINDPPVDAEPMLHKGGGGTKGDATPLPDFNRFDFPDMDWVSAKTYTGVEVMNGHRCLIFKKDDETAWIDIETRFPVQWQQGEETRTFQQLPPPEGQLVLPSKIAHLAAGMKRDRDKWANFSVPAAKK